MTKPATRPRMPADLTQAPALTPMISRAQMTVCVTWSQTFGMRRLALAYHHGSEPHDPL
jgi:hypothetical protein